jgi:hypothetical protein
MAFLNPRTKSFLTVILPTCPLNWSSLAIAMWLLTLVHNGPVTPDQTHDLVNYYFIKFVTEVWGGGWGKGEAGEAMGLPFITWISTWQKRDSVSPQMGPDVRCGGERGLLQLDVHSLDGLKNGKIGLVRVHGWQGTQVTLVYKIPLRLYVCFLGFCDLRPSSTSSCFYGAFKSISVFF